MKLIRISLVALCAVWMMSGTAFSSGDPNACKTQYPVILAHGMGASAEILGIVDYWWGIEDALSDAGADVYITSVNGMDSSAAKGEEFTRQFLEIMAVTGASKANIIGHSHGTIYTRYAISNLGIGDQVASYTSLCGPHQCSALADAIMFGTPDAIKPMIAGSLDFIYAYLFGDTDPDSLENGYDVTTVYMDAFNNNTPDVNGVYYQSWAAKAKTGCPSVIMEATWLAMLILDGPNDGLVGVDSAKWGNFRGIEDGAWYSPGVDHLNIVGQLFGVTPGFDAPEFFCNVVGDLKSRGY